MKQAIKILIEKVIEQIERDWYEVEETRSIVMSAYNLYNKEVNNGYDVFAFSVYPICRSMISEESSGETPI